MKLDDIKWQTLNGGYRIPYDASIVFNDYRQNKINIKNLWDELWENLHHQGDVGEASYASISLIAEVVDQQSNLDSNAFAIAATIENSRKLKQNPLLPEWLEKEYFEGLHALLKQGFEKIDKNWNEDLSCAYLMLMTAYLGLNDHSELMSRTGHEAHEILECE